MIPERWEISLRMMKNISFVRCAYFWTLEEKFRSSARCTCVFVPPDTIIFATFVIVVFVLFCLFFFQRNILTCRWSLCLEKVCFDDATYNKWRDRILIKQWVGEISQHSLFSLLITFALPVHIREFKIWRRQRQQQRHKSMIWLVEWRK